MEKQRVSVNADQKLDVDKNEIQEVILKLQNATAHRNVSEVMECFADENVMFVLSPPLQTITTRKSKPAPNLQEWFDSWRSNLNYFSRELHIDHCGDVGFAHCLTYMGGEKKSGEKTDLWFRESFGLRNLDGHWKITHQHQSVPFLMDGSNKAALDLKPESH